MNSVFIELPSRFYSVPLYLCSFRLISSLHAPTLEHGNPVEAGPRQKSPHRGNMTMNKQKGTNVIYPINSPQGQVCLFPLTDGSRGLLRGHMIWSFNKTRNLTKNTNLCAFLRIAPFLKVTWTYIKGMGHLPWGRKRSKSGDGEHCGLSIPQGFTGIEGLVHEMVLLGDNGKLPQLVPCGTGLLNSF